MLSLSIFNTVKIEIFFLIRFILVVSCNKVPLKRNNGLIRQYEYLDSNYTEITDILVHVCTLNKQYQNFDDTVTVEKYTFRKISEH